MADNTQQRVVAALYVEWLEDGYTANGAPTKIRRHASRGETIAVTPSVAARMDARGSLCPAEWGTGPEVGELIEQAMKHKRDEYVSARSVGGAVEETMTV